MLSLIVTFMHQVFSSTVSLYNLKPKAQVLRQLSSVQGRGVPPEEVTVTFTYICPVIQV
jgi:hypothetical protein